MIRNLRLVGIALVLIGAGLISYALTLPIYTDETAPARLSQELHPGQIREWYAQLATFETPHKRLFNWGQGIGALGVSVIAAIAVLRLYLRNARLRNFEGFLIGWNILWLLHFPATIYFYGLRQAWFEYPAWSDTISIAITRDFAAWIVGALVSSLLLLPFFYRYTLPAQLQRPRPDSLLARTRLGLLGLWEMVLIFSVVMAIPDGDLGMIVPCVLAAALLLLLICAEPTSKSAANPNPA